MRPRGRAPLPVPALIVACLAALAAPAAAQQSGFQYNGITMVSWWFDEYDGAQAGPSRQALRDTGSNWMGLLLTWYQTDAQANTVARNPDPNKDHSDARIRTAIRDAHARGMQVMLKPHVDALNGQWRGDFNPSNPDAWFASYTSFILHYAQIAEEEGVELFCFGTEFRTITSNRANDARWTAVINAVRNVYSGPLTYAANATYPADEFTTVGFWDQVDLIGLDGYFNLTNLDNPTVQQLIAAWTNNRNGENSVAAVQNLANSRGKPLIFTEIGYKSTNRTNVEPWNFGLSGAVDTQEQRDCYEAAFTVWSQQSSWMRGVFWWAWPVPPPPANDGDYNPRTKPAEQVLRTWQGGTTGPNFSLSASPASLTVNQGASGTSSIGITRTGGFTGSVDLSATGLPGGVTASFSPDPTTGNTSTLTLNVSSAAATGTSNVTINGAGSPGNRSTSVSLTVSPGSNYSLSANPASVSVNRGASVTSAITISRTNFTGSVDLSATGLPSGVTASFNPDPTTGNTSTLTLTASATATTGTVSVTINGASSLGNRSTTLSVTVNAPNFSLVVNPTALSVSRGGNASATITVVRSGGFTAQVCLGVGGTPSGVTPTLNHPCTPPDTFTLALAASSSAAFGTFNLTLTGTGGGLTRTATLSLTVIGSDFTLSASPASLSINQGASGTSSINITRSGGFTGSVDLSATGLPGGVTASFSPDPTTGNTSTLTLAASATATTGTANVTINGVGSVGTRTTSLSLTVNGPNFTLSASPASLTVNQGASGTSVINIIRTSFTGSVDLSASGLPSGVTASFSPDPTTGNSSTLTLSAAATAATGTAAVTITGTGSGLTRTTSLSLTVSGGGGNGGVTLTAAVGGSPPWYNESRLTLANTGSLTSVTVNIVVQRTAGITFNGMYNTVGEFQQTNSGNSNPATISYQWTRTVSLGPGSGRLFVAQTNGTTAHPTSGDQWSVTYTTTGGQTFTQSGTFP